MSAFIAKWMNPKGETILREFATPEAAIDQAVYAEGAGCPGAKAFYQEESFTSLLYPNFKAVLPL